MRLYAANDFDEKSLRNHFAFTIDRESYIRIFIDKKMNEDD